MCISTIFDIYSITLLLKTDAHEQNNKYADINLHLFQSRAERVETTSVTSIFTSKINVCVIHRTQHHNKLSHFTYKFMFI